MRLRPFIYGSAPPPPSLTGYVLGATEKTTVDVEVTENGASYTVAAQVDGQPSNAMWKAMLKPHAAGGNLTITASCKECANTTAFTIADITFGDVFICSGQVGLVRVPFDSFEAAQIRKRK